jgi:hypothetical protein
MSNAVYISAIAFLQRAALQGGGGGWFTWAALAAISLVLLICGILLMILGTSDLVRDLLHFLRQRSEAKNHSSH